MPRTAVSVNWAFVRPMLYAPSFVGPNSQPDVGADEQQVSVPVASGGQGISLFGPVGAGPTVHLDPANGEAMSDDIA